MMAPDPLTVDRPRVHGIVRHRTVAEAQGVAVVAGGAFLVTVAITLAVSLVADVSISGWDVLVGFSRWYAGGLGVYLTAVFLPLYVAHGRTRREFLAAVPVIVAVSAALLAVAVTLGYVLESVVYGVAGWSQTLTGWSEQLIIDGSMATYATIGTRHLLLMLVWIVGGMLAGATFYRRAALGLATIPLLLLVAALTEAVLGGATLPQLARAVEWLGLDEAGWLGSAIMVSALCAVVCGALTWAIARDQPLRTRDG